LQEQLACFKEFPNQCGGCSQYRETRQDLTEQLTWMSGMGLAYPQYPIKIVKECIAYHKRVVEYLK